MLRSLRLMSTAQRGALLFALTVGPITFIVTWILIHRRNKSKDIGGIDQLH